MQRITALTTCDRRREARQGVTGRGEEEKQVKTGEEEETEEVVELKVRGE